MNKKLLILGAVFFSSISFSATNDKIQTAINVVESLCLSGTEYGIDADLDGNITIKNFRPKGSGSVTLNARESKGATAFQNDLRIIADEKIRACTQKQIGRILDAVLETTKHSKTINSANRTIGQSKYLGYIPEQVILYHFVDGDELSYFRFSVKQASKVSFIAVSYTHLTLPTTPYV